MNITDTYPITYNKPVKTDAIDANKAMRIAAPEELENYTITKNFDRYVGVSPSDKGDEVKPSYEIIDPSKIYQPELSADMDDMEIKAAVGSLFEQIGSHDYSIPYNSSYERTDPNSYWGRIMITYQVQHTNFNEDGIADIAAKAGSEIDRYYSEGKISDEQYGRFNDEIKSAVKSFLEELTISRVSVAEDRENAEGYAKFGFAYNSMRPQSWEERQLRRIELRQQIEKENPLDLDQFFMKIDQMRAKVTGINASNKESGSARTKTGSN